MSGANSRLKKLGTSTKEEIINRIFRVVEIITETRWTICDYTSKAIMLKNNLHDKRACLEDVV